MNSQEALPLLKKLIKSNKHHAHYNKVVQLREEYLALITDEEINEKVSTLTYHEIPTQNGTTPTQEKRSLVKKTMLSKYLKRFVKREDIDLFDQRVNLTNHYTPSICNAIMEVYNKSFKTNRIYKVVESSDAGITKEINEAIKNFYGVSADSGVDEFLRERYKILTFTDPNAWVQVSFNSFDSKKEKAKPVPVEYSSEEVINFSVKNKITEWVLIKSSYTYLDKDDKEKKADKYIMYLDDEAIEVLHLKEDAKDKIEVQETYIENENKKYGINYYEHKSGMVPLKRIGFIPDIYTNSETFVNPFHYPALNILREVIKVTSELQLSITLHAFPQKIAYTLPCDAKGCDSGRGSDGNICDVCNGTGQKKHHNTAMDVLEIPLPKNFKNGDPLQDISKIAGYITTPIEVLTFLENYVEKKKKEAIRSVFRSESILQADFKTATEAQIDYDSIYDTLQPFAEQYSKIWMFIVQLIATYLDYDKNKIIIYHKYASDFKIKSIGQLMKELENAKNAGANSYILEALNNDIVTNIYTDDPDTLIQINTKTKHFPFNGKSIEEINNIINNGLTTKYFEVLYANFDIIFDELEIEIKDFYKLNYSKQRELISEKVNNIIAELDKKLPKIEF